MKKPKKITLWVRKHRLSFTVRPGIGWGKLPNKPVYGLKVGVLRVSRAPHRIKANAKILTWR